MKNKKKIIIIGAKGFIGNNFCKKYKDRFNILKIGHQYGNLAVEKNWQNLPKAEIMIQLANFNSIEKSFSSPNQVIKNNIDLIKDLIAIFTCLNLVNAIFPVTYTMCDKCFLYSSGSFLND